MCAEGKANRPLHHFVVPLPREWEAKVASLPREEQAPPLQCKIKFVRGRFCRREKFIRVVGVDVLGDPCDQRDRSAVGVGKEGVFVGETISLPRATCLRSIRYKIKFVRGRFCKRRLFISLPLTGEVARPWRDGEGGIGTRTEFC